MSAESQTKIPPEWGRNRKRPNTVVQKIEQKLELNWGDSPKSESGSGNVMMNE